MGDHDAIVAHQDLLVLAQQLFGAPGSASTVESARIVALPIIAAALLDIAESLRRLTARPRGEA